MGRVITALAGKPAGWWWRWTISTVVGLGLAVLCWFVWWAIFGLMAVAFVFVVINGHQLQEASRLSGYITGRQELIASMFEAMDRGFTIEEWMRAESERNVNEVMASLPKRDREKLKKELKTDEVGFPVTNDDEAG